MSSVHPQTTYTLEAMRMLEHLTQEFDRILCELAEKRAIQRSQLPAINEADIESATRELVNAFEASPADEATKSLMRNILVPTGDRD